MPRHSFVSWTWATTSTHRLWLARAALPCFARSHARTNERKPRQPTFLRQGNLRNQATLPTLVLFFSSVPATLLTLVLAGCGFENRRVRTRENLLASHCRLVPLYLYVMNRQINTHMRSGTKAGKVYHSCRPRDQNTHEASN